MKLGWCPSVLEDNPLFVSGGGGGSGGMGCQGSGSLE